MFFCVFREPGCTASFREEDRLLEHMVSVHKRGYMVLCQCGYMCWGPNSWKSHNKNFRKHSKALNNFVRLLRQKYNKSSTEFVFEHRYNMQVYTSNPDRFIQISHNSLNNIKEFLKKYFRTLFINQQKFWEFKRSGVPMSQCDKYFFSED